MSPRKPRPAPRGGFPADLVEALDAAKILGVRAGATHRWTGVWVVVEEGRAFVRSWNDAPTGWFRAFLAEPEGAIRVGDREVPVRGDRVRSARLRNAVTAALARKYPTPGSRKWVEGFAEPGRATNTLELTPR